MGEKTKRAEGAIFDHLILLLGEDTGMRVYGLLRGDLETLVQAAKLERLEETYNKLKKAIRNHIDS